MKTGYKNKETINYNEFKAWLTGMIIGKGGALPDLDDWKMIKTMMDKVVPEKETITIPSAPAQPYQPYQPSPWTTQPLITCGDAVTTTTAGDTNTWIRNGVSGSIDNQWWGSVSFGPITNSDLKESSDRASNDVAEVLSQRNLDFGVVKSAEMMDTNTFTVSVSNIDDQMEEAFILLFGEDNGSKKENS